MNNNYNKISQYKLILSVTLFYIIFDNVAFFSNTIHAYALSGINVIYISSLAILLTALTLLIFTLFSSRYTTKPLLIVALIVSSITNYFMNNYHVIIDSDMIRNALQTNYSESIDLFSFQLILYTIFLGILPAYVVYQIPINYGNDIKKEIIIKIKIIFSSLVIILIILFSFSKFYTSFFRENKPLRFYTNPTYWLYSIGKYIGETYSTTDTTIKIIAPDAKIIQDDNKLPKLVIVVVGEAARADKFSLNGYNKETNPLLKQEDIVDFSNFYSCGTSTAESVPCMFSIYPRDNYSYKKGRYTQNVLDVLEKTNAVEILWRDNNSDSKGVALRVKEQNYKTNKTNTICDQECRDEGMLVGLDNFIKNKNKKDILIILHQMGNHGPAYYKRYPKRFEKFTPVCKTNQLEQCTKEEINNAYDNAILYTDYFLSKTINFLKKYDNSYETSMIYMSDHGESLGKNGIYLHGLPYFMAPDAQKHIGSIFYSNNKAYYNIKKDSYYSQDNLFHTLLGLYDVKTKVYNKKLDMFKGKN